MTKSRALEMFFESIKSPATRKAYDYQLNIFKKHFKFRTIESILKIESKQIQIYIEDYIIHLKRKGLSRSYINQGICAIQLFLVMNDIVLNWKKLKKLLANIEIPKATDTPYSTENIKRMVEVTRSLRDKAIIHFLAASGVRIGALPRLKLKHLTEMPHRCKSALVYAESQEEYVTFLTTEASATLDDYFNQRRHNEEILTPESPVFRSRYSIGSAKAQPMTVNSLTGMIKNILKDIDIRKPKGKRFEQIRFHGLRKRFATILKLDKNINQNAVERLLGHKNGLDSSYYKPARQELFSEYILAMRDLIVDDALRVKAQLESEKTEHDAKIAELKSQNEKIENERFVGLRKDFEQLKISIIIGREWDQIQNEKNSEKHKELARKFALRYNLNPDQSINTNFVTMSPELIKSFTDVFSDSK
ncbi:site-specific integrase [Candidatus Nitrosotenuis chungbukensis]|uniref:tyrosine-type recombinase/integrase n=1 Tax=Candidatus Nitrosotenuis chungbukensis TaxID=1353246 RepID=UPI0005B293D0|nr:site-specific integrase [Candidatus Nitrosotenuis chungbukensis]WKT58106.1 site-specific integrase [Candidatus Nitrosotenuis chungbukensis]